MSNRDALAELHREIEECVRCPLYLTRNRAVPGEGPIDAKIMLVGEAPGAAEDETGRPFVGRSGMLLTRLLKEIGIGREDVFITSVLKSRPPRNRVPNHSEIDACMPYLMRQLAIINPRVVVLLGGIAVSSLIGPWKISEAHGRFYETEERLFFITYHPSAVLRSPQLVETMRADFRLLAKELT
ncbi:MAG: uracil-DNA glycosylase [Candidatus Thorarchaeota archaeon]|nr:uracil-DNA glycosylase [Candidatus Thorarchaeota archaeon]